MPDVSPTKWHRAHTSWFFETFLLEPSLAGYRSFHPAFAYLFNSYYEGVGARYPRPRRGLVSRPGVTEVAEYRRHVDRAMGALLEGRPRAPTPADLVELGLHHEQQHQELLLMDIKHVLVVQSARSRPTPRSTVAEPSTARPPLRLDRARRRHWSRSATTAPGFAFDNESPRHARPPRALRPGRPGRDLRRVDGLHGRRGLQPPRPVAVRRLGHRRRPTAGTAPLYWFAGGRRLVAVHPGRAPAGRPGRAGVPRELLRGRRLRPLERGPAAHRGRVGDGGRRTGRPPGRADFLDTERPAPPSGRPAPTVLVRRRVAVDVECLQPLPRLPAGRRARWASTTASSWSTSTCCAAGRCVTPPGHIRATYRNFFPPSARWAFSGLRLARDC